MATGAVVGMMRALADVFLPRFCVICGGGISHENPIDICGTCEGLVRRRAGRQCGKCAAGMPEYGEKCPNCHNMSLAMKSSTSYGLHTGALRESILAYKFGGRRHYARTFGQLVARAARSAWPEVTFDAVIAVPLHRKRLKERGFDQSRSVASHAARALGAADKSGALARIRATDSQVGLTRSARLKNVKQAFAAANCRGLMTVLVVDDIMTTGATLSEAARTLKKAGVKNVYAAVVARADLSEETRMGPEVGGPRTDK